MSFTQPVLFAYQEIRAYRGKTYSQWEMVMIDHCVSLNENLSEPMTYREVRCIAKSISRFCWKMMRIAIRSS